MKEEIMFNNTNDFSQEIWRLYNFKEIFEIFLK